MKKINRLYICLAFAVMLLVSCREEPVVPDDVSLKIFSVNPDAAYLGQEIIINGNGFGEPTDSSFVIFNDSLAIAANECIKWNMAQIRLNVPKDAVTSGIRVVIGSDTSNHISITINLLPPFEMADIPAGDFMMGSESGMDNESPVHKVNITKSFLMSKTEVTNLLWNAVMSINPSDFKEADQPVSNISWHEAVFFCNRLSKMSGLDTCYYISGDTVKWIKTANGFRLPTEAEWEYACRAGSTADFYGTGSVDDIAWYSSNSGYKPHPVAAKPANAFGLFDMLGNVWEWCWDWYNSTYYKSSPSSDPEGPARGSIRVLRGGSWHDGSLYLRASNRSFQDNTVEFAGFRIVRNK